MNLIGDLNKLRDDSVAFCIYDCLNRCLNSVQDADACLYYNHPFYRGDIRSDLISAKLFLVSKRFGLILFHYSEGDFSEAMAEYIDTLYNEISSRLLKRQELRASRRSLRYDISTVVVTDNAQTDADEFMFSSLGGLKDSLEECRLPDPIGDDMFQLILSCIDGTSTLTLKKERTTDSAFTKAKILNCIQSKIASFDIRQRQIADVDFDGPQRIRGLAGSGKTIVLAYKAAAFHAHYPDRKILYTYYTKSLGDTVKSLISRAYKNYSSGEPDWNNVVVCHAWGSAVVPGVYYMACQANGVAPLTFRDTYGAGTDPFSYVCDQLLQNDIKPEYDLILIDEGQDFRQSFYRLCYRLSKNRRISWAYDDFQNIFDVNIQDEEKTFGHDSNGVPLVRFDSGNPLQDVPLKQCYRTPRYTLVYAFSLGLGIYNSKVLQRLGSNRQWEDLGFEVEEGSSETGDRMVVSRPEANTPSYSNESFDENALQYARCDDMKAECEKISDEIVRYIREDGLRPDDICVICIDSKYVSNYLNVIESLLMDRGIRAFNHLNAPYNSTRFFAEDSVTLTTVNRAKGNECGAVFICGADHVFRNKDNVVLRDKLFTAMTRTKGWLYITGMGDSMNHMIDEINELKRNGFKLIFTQPAEEDTKNIENVSRQTLQAEDSISREIKNLRHLGLGEEDIKKILENLISKS